jgi:Ni,Fe-hydrogenase III small subunit
VHAGKLDCDWEIAALLNTYHVPVDAYVLCCPPPPEAIIEGTLPAVGRLDERRGS